MQSESSTQLPASAPATNPQPTSTEKINLVPASSIVNQNAPMNQQQMPLSAMPTAQPQNNQIQGMKKTELTHIQPRPSLQQVRSQQQQAPLGQQQTQQQNQSGQNIQQNGAANKEIQVQTVTPKVQQKQGQVIQIPIKPQQNLPAKTQTQIQVPIQSQQVQSNVALNAGVKRPASLAFQSQQASTVQNGQSNTRPKLQVQPNNTTSQINRQSNQNGVGHAVVSQHNATVQNSQSRQIVNGNSMQQRTTVKAQHVVTKPSTIATTQVKLPTPANPQATGTSQMKISSPQPVKNGQIQQVKIQQQQSQVPRQQVIQVPQQRSQVQVQGQAQHIQTATNAHPSQVQVRAPIPANQQVPAETGTPIPTQGQPTRVQTTQSQHAQQGQTVAKAHPSQVQVRAPIPANQQNQTQARAPIPAQVRQQGQPITMIQTTQAQQSQQGQQKIQQQQVQAQVQPQRAQTQARAPIPAQVRQQGQGQAQTTARVQTTQAQQAQAQRQPAPGATVPTNQQTQTQARAPIPAQVRQQGQGQAQTIARVQTTQAQQAQAQRQPAPGATVPTNQQTHTQARAPIPAQVRQQGQGQAQAIARVQTTQAQQAQAQRQPAPGATVPTNQQTHTQARAPIPVQVRQQGQGQAQTIARVQTTQVQQVKPNVQQQQVQAQAQPQRQQVQQRPNQAQCQQMQYRTQESPALQKQSVPIPVTSAVKTSPISNHAFITSSLSTDSENTLAPLKRENKNLSEKKIRRLEKNRLSARNCRRKKKEYTQSLQNEIKLLERENLRLRLQLQIGQEAEQSTMKEQVRLTEGIDELLKSGASDSEIFNSIEVFKEKFADYGRDRRSAIEFHLRNVERLLMPTTTTSVAMRALQGGMGTSHKIPPTVPIKKELSDATEVNDGEIKLAATTQSEEDFKCEVPVQPPANTVSNKAVDEPEQNEITSQMPTGTIDSTASANQKPAALASAPKLKNADPKELFTYLVNFLNVTPEQAAALKDSRHVAKELDQALEKSLSMLGDLKERLTDMGQDLDAEFSAIRSILTPRQAAKFLVWVANNGACMHMLNELWNKVYPEPVGVHGEDEDDVVTKEEGTSE